jgi:hypothetical protein
MSTLGSVLIAILMMQLLTYFWRFRQCQLNFMPFRDELASSYVEHGLLPGTRCASLLH